MPNTAPHIIIVETQLSSIRPRARYSRSKTGCLTCRQRRKKCDERKPNCVACVRNSFDCSWPSRVTPDTDEFASEHLRGGNARRHSPPPQAPSSVSELEPLDCLLPNASTQSGPVDTETTSAQSSLSSPWRDSNLVALPALKFGASKTLLAHYLAETGTLLATCTPQQNPFLCCLVPLASKDELLMHGLLALSGAHLTFKQPDSFELRRTTQYHYATVLKSLRGLIDDKVLANKEKKLRFMSVLVVLAFFEVLWSDSNGSLFVHLRASRQLSLALLNDFSLGSNTMDECRLLQFVLEVHSYLVLFNNLTAYNTIQARTIPFDSALLSHDIIEASDGFGSVFGGTHQLFKLLPSIAKLATTRLEHDADLDPPKALVDEYKMLHGQITTWNPTPVYSSDANWLFQRYAIMEICRMSVFLFIETAMWPPTPKYHTGQSSIRSFINIALAHLTFVSSSPFEGLLLWPLLIIGSCAVEKDHQQSITTKLMNQRYQMRQCVQASKLLKLLWEDQNDQVFGPRGLSEVMQKHGILFGNG